MIRALKLETIAEEIRLSYSLLFGRNENSMKIATTLFKEKKTVEVRFIDYKKLAGLGRGDGWKWKKPHYNTMNIVEWDEGRSPTLTHFPYFKTRLATLLREMNEWRPENVSDLWIPAYSDRFIFYTTIFGSLVAILGDRKSVV